MSRVPLNERREWQALEEHYRKIRHLHLRDLFATDPKRGERLTAEAVGLYLDSIGIPILRLALRPGDTRARWGREGSMVWAANGVDTVG
jgi:hypothetical protein